MSKKTARVRREVDITDIDLEETFNNNWLLNFNLRKPFYFNPAHQQFYDCIKNKDTKMAFVDGPAGTMKTYIAVYSALELIKNKEFEKLIYIRSIAESAEKSLGSLPGEIDDKFSPYAMPLIEKVREVSNDSTCNMLKQKGVIEAIPVNFVRGLTFNNAIVIVDESQNLSRGELTTILTRFGRDSKYIICGDCKQADIGTKSGFKDIFTRFDTEKSVDNNIHAFKFGTSEIVRSKILRYICSVLEA